MKRARRLPLPWPGIVHQKTVKECLRCADNSVVRFDLTHPTQHEVREGLISGLIAESIAIPVLIAVILLDHHHLRWSYLAGAIACVVVSAVYLAFSMVITKEKDVVAARSTVGFVMACLALSALAFVELGTSDKYGIFAPALMVGVIFVCIIGDQRMRIAIGVYATALIVVIAWSAGLRGSSLAAAVVVSGSTIAIITCLTARTVGASNGRINVRRSIEALNLALDEAGPDGAGTNADLLQDAFRRGLPLVSGILPADRVTVFARHGKPGRFITLAGWPSVREDTPEVAELAELTQALDSDLAVLTPTICAIPIGYCVEGELVMVVQRTSTHGHTDEQAADAAHTLATAFLRVTNRANFVSGLQIENRADPLTGLANRQTLQERIQIEMDHALRSESPLSVAMIDLDHFKQYNERHGSVAGDTVLRSIAAIMVSNIRRQDLVVRYGGEEFFLIMPDTDILGGHHLLDKLRAGGRDATSEFGITLSAGLTSWDGIEDTASLIERADQALYRAKESGRNRVVSIQSFTEF